MGYYKAFGLPAEACALCKECAYPKQCKFPNEKRPSVEACSIDVFQTLKNLGKSATLARSVGECYHSYSLILLA
jgi:predicted metal-binding protein